MNVVKNCYNIILALVGTYQLARPVQQLAHQGYCDVDMLRILPNSIIDMNPNSTLAVLGSNEANLHVGLEILPSVLNASSHQGPNAELAHYTLSLMVLKHKLSSARGTLDIPDNRINGLQHQFERFDLRSETLMSAVAAIYVDVTSPSGPRIQVTSSLAVLQSPQVQVRARAILLAGIRAAMLWHQVGGGRLQPMFSRNRLAIQAKQILVHLTPGL